MRLINEYKNNLYGIYEFVDIATIDIEKHSH